MSDQCAAHLELLPHCAPTVTEILKTSTERKKEQEGGRKRGRPGHPHPSLGVSSENRTGRTHAQHTPTPGSQRTAPAGTQTHGTHTDARKSRNGHSRRDKLRRNRGPKYIKQPRQTED